LDHVRTRNLTDPVDKFTGLKRFQSLASELISPTIQSDSGEEVDKATRDFTAPTASAYRQTIEKQTYIVGPKEGSAWSGESAET
jgi:hypothetical protein